MPPVCPRSVRRPALAAALTLALTASATAAPPQSPQQGPPPAQVPAPPVPVDSGFGVYEAQSTPCVTDRQRARIRAEIARNQRMLTATGGLDRPMDVRVQFIWPLVPVGDAAASYGYHGISGFVDHDPTYPGNLLDYNCGTRSYDLSSGYNHQGIDFFTWPLGWTWMDNDAVHIVAAAPGTIVYKSDGNFDESCGFGGGGWNAVYVQHADGSVAWYGHMKDGSPTSKGVGDTVLVGEYLGVVGSSGNSTGPHLHLELYDALGNLVDPYGGPCNTLSTRSWWWNQGTYYDSGVNRLMVGDAAASFPACPGRLITNEAGTIARDTVGYFTTFYRDQLGSQTSTYRIRRPNGTVWHSWTHSSGATHYAASWWWWSWIIPGSEPTGTWTFEVEFDGVTYTETFGVS